MLLRYLLKTLALPPALNILIILLALLFCRRSPRLRALLIAVALISLAVLATPFAAQQLANRLERFAPLQLNEVDANHYQAIVILGSGRYRDAPEYGGDGPNGMGLERLRYGAYVQRATGLPILVTGGMLESNDSPEAEFMAQVVEREFGGAVAWREAQSRTTWENAQYVKAIAEQQQLKKELLVTHAWHMPRALFSFERAGMSVTPAPTGFRSLSQESWQLLDFVPQAAALYSSSLMLHEMLGLFWYLWEYQ